MDYFINRAKKSHNFKGEPYIESPVLVITSDNPEESPVYIDLGEIYQAWGHYANLLMGDD